MHSQQSLGLCSPQEHPPAKCPTLAIENVEPMGYHSILIMSLMPAVPPPRNRICCHWSRNTNAAVMLQATQHMHKPMRNMTEVDSILYDLNHATTG